MGLFGVNIEDGEVEVNVQLNLRQRNAQNSSLVNKIS